MVRFDIIDHDAPGRHNGLFSDIGHHNRAVPQPGILSNDDLFEVPALFAHGNIDSIKVVLIFSADDIDVGSEHHIVFDSTEADGAVGANIDTFPNFNVFLVENRTELDTAVVGTAF